MDDTIQIFCDRWFDAPPALVFRAFTEPELLERWFCPLTDVTVHVEECDPRPGGRYRFVFAFPDGRVVPVLGEYRAVTPDEQLVFTWTWEPPDPWVGVVTVVIVDFLPKDGGTQVHVRHQQFATIEMKVPHEAGWSATLERLASWLTHIGGTEGRAIQELK